MSYIDQNLTAGEQVVYQAKLHWAIFISPAIFTLIGLGIMAQGRGMAIIGFIIVLIGLLRAISAATTYLTTEFAVTNRRVIGKIGLIRRQSLEVLLSKVESISVDQSIMGRLFGYGTIVVSGSGGTRNRFPSIADPLTLRQKVNYQISTSMTQP